MIGGPRPGGAALIEGTSQVLDTKLHVPRLRPNAVARPRLTARLDEGCRGCLVVVSAPAGFGKTTVISDWVATGTHSDRDVGVAWLSLDEGDNDLARFLTYLVLAVRATSSQVGEQMLARLRSAEPVPTDEVLTTVLNEVAELPHDVVLVLDDFHVIDSEEVDQAMVFLIENLPPQLHVVIATREDPRMPLARWRARGVLSELRAADLRFTLAETTEFLRTVMGLDLLPEDVASLEARTEGWIAGLQLAGLHLQGRADPAEAVRSFAGSHRFVFDYLVEEVLAHLTDQERRFLLQTSILDRMTADLCEVVTGQRASALMLERLERANLFVVALDDRRHWYRYHHLFAEVLRVRLHAEHPDQVRVLHRRASDWYAANGMHSEAVGHALSAEEYERAAELLERAGQAVEDGSHAGAWFTHAQALPDGLIRARPALAVWYAYALLGRGDLEAAGTYVADAERLLATASSPAGQAPPGSGPVEAEERRSLLARIAVARGYLAQAQGDTAATVAHARRALELVPDAERARRDQATALLGMAALARGDLEEVDRVFSAVTARLLAAGDIADAIDTVCLLADVRTIMGHLRRAVDTVEQLQAIVAEREVTPPPEMAELYRAWAELDLARGDLAAAAEHLSQSQQFGQLREMPVWRYRWRVAQAQLRWAQGDPRTALGFLDEAQRLFVRTPMPDLRPVAAIRASIWAGQGRVGDALSWARERGLSVDDDLDLLHEYEHLTLARILIADKGRGEVPAATDDAVALLDRLLPAALHGARVGSAIEILVAQAVAHEARDRRPEAVAALEQALALGEAEGYVQVFVDQGPPVAGLLRELAAHGSTPDSAARVLAAFPESGDGAGPSHTAALGASPPLSAREVEVLQCIAAGLSNQEIATRLYVSKYTVKAHARTIYDKLEVHSRTAAVTRAQQLGILPSR